MNREIIERAVIQFGTKKQVSKSIEELSELITELARFENDAVRYVNLISEIADASIMIEQLKLIFGPDLVEGQIHTKLKRLEGLLK